ncbi:MAG: MFS transporter, partial [Chloroflexi bacterium]|nr:MFS transporter [Chloroflexota bacterium]
MIKPWQHGIPRHSRDVWLIAAASGLCSSAFLGMMQLLKVLYVLRLGCGPELVGTLFAAGALSFSLSSLPGGALGARFGPRRMMIVASLALAVGLLQMTCIPQWVSAGVGLAATLALSA